MSTIDHPRFTQHSYGGNDQKTLITTYDLVSTSPSKLKYSFGDSKSVRFPKYNATKQKGHDQVGYNLPSTKSSRGAGFGVGDRFKDPSKNSKSPSPDRYNAPTLFKPDNTTSTFAVHCVGDKTYAFGTGRESYKKNVLSKRNLKADAAVPGPGTYDPLAPLGSSALSFKMKHKLTYGEADQIARKRNVPGAGTYEDQLSLHNMGQYNQNSQYNNSKAQRWAPAYDRFKYPKTSKEINPGPGQHEQFGELHTGSQVNSQYHSIKSPTFNGSGGRTQYVGRFKTPGPGSYRAPSDFGYIDVMARNQQQKDQLAIMTHGLGDDKSRLHEGSITSKRGSIKNKSNLTYYETIPELGTSRNRFFNKSFLSQSKPRKVSLAPNTHNGPRIKKHLYQNQQRDHINYTTPKARTGTFQHKHNSVIQNTMSNDRRESERHQSKTLDYTDRQKMNETTRIPDTIYELQEHMQYMTPQKHERIDELNLTEDQIMSQHQRVQSDMYVPKKNNGSLVGTDTQTTNAHTPAAVQQ